CSTSANQSQMMEGCDQTSENPNEQVSCPEEQPVDPMEDFSRQLEDIINTYGAASNLMQEQISILEAEERKEEEAKADKEANPQEAGATPEKEQIADKKILKALGEQLYQFLKKKGLFGHIILYVSHTQSKGLRDLGTSMCPPMMYLFIYSIR
uniref:Uncharacterized protein n=1 Tax=Cyprinus carpio TaxID=7962 RepID=A0A8C2KZB5_CYPCA